MGVNRYKITVECDCGCDWGANCGKKDVYLFCYNRTCDIGTLYVNGEHKISMTDNQIAALIKVLTSNEFLEKCTEEERKLV